MDQKAFCCPGGSRDILPIVNDQTEGCVAEGDAALADKVAQHLEIAAGHWDVTQEGSPLSLRQDADVVVGEMPCFDRTRQVYGGGLRGIKVGS